MSTPTRIIAATGLPFASDRFLNPEREATVLTCIGQHPNGTPTTAIAAALGFNTIDTGRLLQEMLDRGLLRRDIVSNRAIWERASVEVNSKLVIEAHQPLILEFLTGRRELASAIAKALGLPAPEVAETCKAMMLAGELVGTSIGAVTVFARDIRGTQRVDPSVVAPMSPLARMRADLSQLSPAALDFEERESRRKRDREAAQRYRDRQRAEREAATAQKKASQAAARQLQARHAPKVRKPFSNSRRGRLDERSLELLRYLQQPQKVATVADFLKLDTPDAWNAVKSLHQMQYLKRVGTGTYETSPEGRALLAPKRRSSSQIRAQTVPLPPEGKGLTDPARAAWLAEHYPRLGHSGAAPYLKMHPKAVHTYASQHGLVFGAIPGYVMVQVVAEKVAQMHGMQPEQVYQSIWQRGKVAGVMKYLEGDAGKQNRRPLVPVPWADEVILERTPPSSTDMSRAELQTRTGLSKTQAGRVGAPMYLRTVTGEQPALFMDRARGELLVAQYAQKETRHQPGRQGVMVALAAAGAEGHTEVEMVALLGVSRAAVRIHVARLLKDGLIERCRGGATLDPIVWRAATFQAEAEPSQRHPDTSGWGRPRKTPMPEAAD